jgi:HK97 family phage major capsid protein
MKFNATELKELNAACEKAFDAMQENIKRVQDVAEKAAAEVKQEGTLHAKTNDELAKLGKLGNELSEGLKDIKDRIRDVEQKADRRPGAPEARKTAGQRVVESDEFKAAAAAKVARSMPAVMVGSFHNVAISEAASDTTGTLNPLVPADRLAGIVMPGLRRLTVRDLLPSRRTSSNMVEFASENVFTDNAGPQYDTSSPVPGREGADKPESGITFSLTQVPVTTLAHWIPASRQVLSDAPALQSYIDGRLRYGLALEEEREMLHGTNSSGELNGLVTQATAYSGGVTNMTALDTLLKAINQVRLSEYEPSGIVMHPTDWINLMMLKDTTGRYLFSDPQATGIPQVWGKPVVATQSQTLGQFLVGAFTLAAEIVDREDATVRISEQHDKFFVKNMVAILAEERLALVVYRAAAIVKGSLSHAG